MIREYRQRFNQSFTAEKYQRFLQDLENEYNYMPSFRIAETPIFIPDTLKNKLLEACDDILEVINRPDFNERTQGALQENQVHVPGEEGHTLFLQMDFGITLNDFGEFHPQLIELQGFPSLYFFQHQLANAYRRNFYIPESLTTHPNGMTSAEYLTLLKKVIVGDHDPKNVILLEIEPRKQNTAIDFYATEHHLSIKVLCISDLRKTGRKLYYLDEKNQKVAVKRIYNRIIFDELDQRDDLEREFYFEDEVDVEWAGHPNWFFRISKYMLPLLESPYVPKTYYLEDLKEYPGDLENYVLKPLYSFAGSGILLDVTTEELDKITDRKNYILQRKVTYAPVIETPSEPAKCEIRMMMVWEKDKPKAVAVNNLVRLTKGRMVGVKFNKNKDWVGASAGFFES